MITLGAVLALFVIAPAAALAFGESYGGGSLCGSTCYFQSAGAHTFAINEGGSLEGSPYLACQLYNSKNANEVSHGNAYCSVSYFGGEFVWARIYNESGKTYKVAGYAET